MNTSLKPLWERADPSRPIGSRSGPPTALLVLLLGVAVMACLTQWTAWSMAHNAALGARSELGPRWLFIVLAVGFAVAATVSATQEKHRKQALPCGGAVLLMAYLASTPIYSPAGFVTWWVQGKGHPTIAAFFWERAQIGLVVWALAAVVLVVSRKNRGRVLPDLAGSARWATTKDLKASGLLGRETEPGIIIGVWEDRGWQGVKRSLLRETKRVHTFVQGQARSGKGKGLVTPTVLDWDGHAIVTGKRTELESLLRGSRERKGPVFVFAPSSGGDRYNPLMDLRRGRNRGHDISILAHSLAYPESDRGADHGNEIWARAAEALLVSLLHYVLATQKTPTLGACYKLLADSDKTLKRMAKRDELEIAAGAHHVLELNHETRSSILFSAMTGLHPFREEIYLEATEVCDFRVSDLLYGARPATLFLDTSDDTTGGRLLLRLLLNQLMLRVKSPDNMLAPKDGGPAGRAMSYELLFMLDEFRQLGYMKQIADNLEVVPGFGVRFVFIVQNLPAHTQEWNREGRADPLMASCQTVVTYGGLDLETCGVMSDLLGKSTEHYAVKSSRTEVFELFDKNVQNTPHFAARSLMTPSEISELPAGEVLIVRRQQPPVRTHHLNYEDEPAFVERTTIESHGSRHRLERLGKHLDWLAKWCPETFDWHGSGASYLRAYRAARNFVGEHPQVELPSALKVHFTDLYALKDAVSKVSLAIQVVKEIARRKPEPEVPFLVDLMGYFPMATEASEGKRLSLWKTSPSLMARLLLRSLEPGRSPQPWTWRMEGSDRELVQALRAAWGGKFPKRIQANEITNNFIEKIRSESWLEEDVRYDRRGIVSWLRTVSCVVREAARGELSSLATLRTFTWVPAKAPEWESTQTQTPVEPWLRAAFELALQRELLTHEADEALTAALQAGAIEKPTTTAEGLQKEAPEIWLAAVRLLERWGGWVLYREASDALCDWLGASREALLALRATCVTPPESATRQIVKERVDA